MRVLRHVGSVTVGAPAVSRCFSDAHPHPAEASPSPRSAPRAGSGGPRPRPEGNAPAESTRGVLRVLLPHAVAEMLRSRGPRWGGPLPSRCGRLWMSVTRAGIPSGLHLRALSGPDSRACAEARSAGGAVSREGAWRAKPRLILRKRSRWRVREAAKPVPAAARGDPAGPSCPAANCGSRPPVSPRQCGPAPREARAVAALRNKIPSSPLESIKVENNKP
nr:uncharacterized protein LOC105874818 isoform X2 [Microcebus murinus]